MCSIVLTIIITILALKISGILTPINNPLIDLVKPEPTTVIPDPVVIVQQVQRLSRLETASISFEKVIRAERDQKRLWGAFGEKMLFVAYGKVIVGVDLNEFQESDFLLVDSTTVKIHLPQAQIFNVILDNQKSYVASRETGLLASVDSNLETEVRKQAEIEFKSSALSSGIVGTAQKNAEYDIDTLLRQFGFTNIIFTKSAPNTEPIEE